MSGSSSSSSPSTQQSSQKREASTEERKEKKRKVEKTPSDVAVPVVTPAVADVVPVPLDGVIVGDEEKKQKKRKIQRFNPHNVRDYLNINKYWKHHETLRTALIKAETTLAHEMRKEDVNKEQLELASQTVHRYTTLINRLESRHKNVLEQLDMSSKLMSLGPVCSPFTETLLEAFTDTSVNVDENDK